MTQWHKTAPLSNSSSGCLFKRLMQRKMLLIIGIRRYEATSSGNEGKMYRKRDQGYDRIIRLQWQRRCKHFMLYVGLVVASTE